MTPAPALPSAFLRLIFAEFAGVLTGGKALDVACGKGRNALFLSERGFDVVALDIASVALEEGRRQAVAQGLKIEWRQVDLECVPLAFSGLDLVINFNYLQRSLIGPLKQALKPGGHFIFETYLIDQQAIGHPKNPAYLLRYNELLDFFRDFRVLWYREGKFAAGEETAFRAGILAEKPK